MASVLVVGQLLKFRTFCTCDDQTAINVHYGEVTQITGGPRTDDDLAPVLSTALGTLYKPCFGSYATYYGLGLQIFKPNPTLEEVFSSSGQGAGTMTGDRLPMQVAGIITLKEIGIGKKKRGRRYIPFPSEDCMNTTGSVATAYDTVMEALADVLIGETTFVGTGFSVKVKAALYHRDTDTWTPLTTQKVQQKFGTQRRRGRYGRPNPPPF